MKNTTKFLYIDVFMVVVALAVATLSFLSEIHDAAGKQALKEQDQHLKTFWKLIRAKGSDISIVDGKLLVGDYVVNGNNELPDQIQDIFGCTATIFMGDTRISTNVLMPGGKRAVGTKLQGPAYDSIFRQGKPYRGEALILGTPHLTAYDPIKNGTGEIIGALYVGVNKSAYFTTYERLKTKVIVLAAILMTLFSFFAFLLITFRRKAADALEEREVRYRQLAADRHQEKNLLRALIDSIPDLIFFKDHESVYLGCNKAFEAFAGRAEKDLIGLTDLDMFPREVGESFREMDRQMMAQRTARRNEEWVDYPDGRLVLLETLKTPFYDQDGRMLGLIGISRDITERHRAEDERKKLEAQLLQSQKMEAVGQLAGGIAHDFNNILTAIIGYAEIISIRIGEESSLRHYVEQVLAASDRAAELVKGLLSFSRRQVLHPQPVDLCEIVQGLQKMLDRIIREDIDFRTSVSEKELLVMADKGQIEQVLMNFVTNAKDSMPQGGILSIDVSPVSMDRGFVQAHGFGEPGNYACITVADTGCGMDKETQKKIFEPFYTTKEVGKGTGLGMFIIYGIIKQHKGFINLYSEPGSGTTFRVYLPLTDGKKRAALAMPSTAPPQGGTETILLAEDDITVRELHRIILEDAGYTVIEATDGLDALMKFKEQHSAIDLLATDVIMPKIDGKKLHQELQRIRPDMKVLFMSGYTKDIVIDKGILDDQSNFIAKPVTSSELLFKMRNILDRR